MAHVTSPETLPGPDRFADWSRRLRRDDRSAFAELFEATHAPLLRFAWRFSADEATAQDVVQDVFVKLWTMRATLDDDRSLRALLYTMVRNLALNRNRAAARATVDAADVALPALDPGQDAEAEARLLGDHLERWIAALPDRRREAFLLSRLHGLTHDEIAGVMDLTPRTVNTHIVLALNDLRTRLAALEPDRR